MHLISPGDREGCSLQPGSRDHVPVCVNRNIANYALMARAICCGKWAGARVNSSVERAFFSFLKAIILAMEGVFKMGNTLHEV